MKKLSKKRLAIVISFLVIILAGSFITYRYLVPKQIDNSLDYMPGVVTFQLKPEYAGRQDTIEDLAKSVKGKIDFCTSDKDLCDVTVEVGSERKAEQYLKSRQEVNIALRSVRGSVD